MTNKQIAKPYPFTNKFLPENKRKKGTRCKCCKGLVDKRGLCYCKTVLD